MKNFRTFIAAVEFYKQAQKLNPKSHVKDQLNRASLSIALNLAEGRARSSVKDRLRFYNISFSSLREVQALLIIMGMENSDEWKLLDSVAA